MLDLDKGSKYNHLSKERIRRHLTFYKKAYAVRDALRGEPRDMRVAPKKLLKKEYSSRN